MLRVHLRIFLESVSNISKTFLTLKFKHKKKDRNTY